MRRILAVVVGLTLAVLAACTGESASKGEGTPSCRVDADCMSGVCDPFRGCVACRASVQCDEGETCLGGSCRLAQPCTSDQSCAEGQRCSVGAQTCVDCLEPADCAEGSACQDGACQPSFGCDDAKGCRPGTVCDLSRATCVECLGSGDCAAGEKCVDQSCRNACSSDSSCPVGLRCDPLLNLCLECVTSSDCDASRHCSAGRCALDVCVAGSGTCEPVGQAVQLCSASGDRVVPLYCNNGASCEGEPGKGACTDWVCTPGLSACNPAGLLETCAKDGLSLATVDCATTNQACVADTCVDVVCEPGEISCDAATNTLHKCSPLGTVDTATPCNGGQYCDVKAGACAPQACTPGAKACVEGVPGVCDALGSGFEPGKACKTNEGCVSGDCKPLVCDPSAAYCGDDGNVYQCDEAGTLATQTAICESRAENGEGGQAGTDYYQHCEKHGSVVACYSDLCSKGKTFCVGNSVQTCNSDGTAAIDAGQDCGADAVCTGYAPASCAPKICTPYTRFCDADGNSSLCGADGASSSIYQYCGEGLYCDALDALCRYETCTPNAAGCNGSVATTCKADGSTWEATGTDCALTGKVCEAGSCKTKVCEPNQYFCSAGNPSLCNAIGTAGTVSDTCAADAYCSPGYWYCMADVCTSGQPICADLEHLATCKADGSGPNGAGTACGANKVCDAGQCKTKVCEPNSLFCSGGHVQACEWSGLAFSQSQYCFADEFCKTLSSASAACAKKVCTSGAKGCNGESYATCDALGSGYVDSPTNCAATGKVCSLTGCATSALDEMGDSSTYEFLYTDNLTGNVFLATASRTLSKLEFDSMADLTGLPIHWAVYSSAAKAGPYTPDFDVITTGGPVGFQSSGAITVSLTAGKYYLAAVQLSGGGYHYMYRSSALTAPMSFGQPVGWLSANAAAGVLPPSVSNVNPIAAAFHFRFTTKP